jgi:hypothetical protein
MCQITWLLYYPADRIGSMLSSLVGFWIFLAKISNRGELGRVGSHQPGRIWEDLTDRT